MNGPTVYAIERLALGRLDKGFVPTTTTTTTDWRRRLAGDINRIGFSTLKLSSSRMGDTHHRDFRRQSCQSDQIGMDTRL